MKVKASTARYTETTDGGFKKLKKGIDNAADIVCSTMGPDGKFVGIGSKTMPFFTRDGATVIKNIKFDDVWDRLGSDMLIDAAMKTENEAGDATTTTCAIVQGILNNLPAKISRRDISDELREAGEELVSKLEEMSVPVLKDGVVNLPLLRKLAIISANNDAKLGTMIADLVAKIGIGGVVLVHDSEKKETYTEIKKGYNYKEGSLSPYFLPAGGRAKIVEHPLVLLIEEKITDQRTLIPIIKAWQDEYFDQNMGFTRSLVLVASDISGSAIDMLNTNYRDRGMPCYAVKAPGLGIERVEGMLDLQVITGAKQVFSERTGNPISKFGKSSEKHFDRAKSRDAASEFGECKRIRFDNNETVFFFEEDDKVKERIDKHIEDMDEVVLESPERENFYKERKSKLRTGIGHIYVWAPSEIEKINKGLTVDDAQLACFAALEEGVIVGGGHTFVKLSKFTKNKILSKALLNPFNILMHNSDVPLSVWDKLRGGYKFRYFEKDMVYNVKSRDWELIYLDEKDEIAGYVTGIIDATKAMKNSIRNAVSVSIQAINSEHLVQWVENK